MHKEEEPKKISTSYFDSLESECIIHSSGRINLIGEHIDYNGGLVLPAAIDKKINIEFKKNNQKALCNVYSKNIGEAYSVNYASTSTTSGWVSYVLGVVSELSKVFPDKIEGFDCIIDSNLPIGSGLSSSAALQCGLAKGIVYLFDLALDDLELIKICQTAEQNFSGTQCGIMDQFSVVKGKKDHLILLDCSTNTHQEILAEFDPYEIVLLNTNVVHNLSDTAYNKRREECTESLEILKEGNPKLEYLVQADESLLMSFKDRLGDTRYDRSLYVVQENQRVKDVVSFLGNKNLASVGQKMYESHDGLSVLYEVSCPELDFLVEKSKGIKEVIGSRMMGGGFGGCTISLVHKDAKDEYIQWISKEYEKEFSIKLTSVDVKLDHGVRNIVNI